ncbi:SusD/RagB family nutrient-binding outer membrane lipoprotein [Spirosoma sp. RP8]|uniref:SusD/RagB family nutrient-binding outer membrane lipoprotein n=1 Tax=Spirosoma liriopis TaxID=2937440 RepID=A0ABT0HRY4_9BACT|nr:SusD/RagB family nutrient-binding outer membrane lipoprotein [Spirosoma liriopis]MCK8494926.1 SusD/RagB family nutrient-binding outer membrane lipoprotein [Spirosoma liriopis]
MKKYSVIALGSLLLSLTGCQTYIDVNKNPNQPLTVQPALLLAPLELAVANELMAGDAARFTNHWTQMIASNQPVPNEGTYRQLNEEVNNQWWINYTTCLQNMKVLRERAEADNSYNYSAIADILTALTLGMTTDLWGDVPYSQAFQGSANFRPAYDKQEDIYKSIDSLLDRAIASIDKKSLLKPGGDDYYYGGDMSKWRRAAYTLKARFAMHLIKAPGRTATAQADLALGALQNGMAANSDDMKMFYLGGAGQQNKQNQNFLPVSTQIMSKQAVDTLVLRNDPRLSKIIAPATETGKYTGRAIGLQDIGSLASYSILGDFYGAASANLYILTYAEALFLKAEATLYKSGATAAEPIYQSAVKANMSALGVSDTDASTYLNRRGKLTSSNALRLIIEEKVIANYLSPENYTDWRRTGYPLLAKVPNALSDIPRRFLYPRSELTTNPQTGQDAKLTDRVWWDVSK